MATDEKHFEDLMEFPAQLTFRAVSSASAGVQAASEAALLAVLGRPADHVEIKESTGGKYWVIRLSATVENADEIRAAYQALHDVDGVRMVM